MSSLAFWQGLGLCGAVLCLTAYAKGAKWSLYGWTNIIGATCLLAVAIYSADLGFILMNGAWLAISVRKEFRK